MIDQITQTKSLDLNDKNIVLFVYKDTRKDEYTHIFTSLKITFCPKL